VDDIGYVVNYNLPHDPEDYVHRIGRTGRAGATGTSISFACEHEAFVIPDIEKLLGHALSCTHPEDELLVSPPPPVRPALPSTAGPSNAAPRPAPRPRASGRPPRRRRRG
jgi:ATP-dependent RNA helicase RhlB